METKKSNKIQQLIQKLPFWNRSVAGGNILDSSTVGGLNKKPITSDAVKALEPYGTKIPSLIKNRASGWSQIANLSHDFSFEKVQSAIRAAERGDMQRLFAYYRDFFIGNSMAASELSKRKLATISEPFKILPINKKNKDDVKAAQIIQQVLDNCPSFNESLVHLMNSIVFPIAAVEKVFEEVTDKNFINNEFNLKYKLKALYAVDYNLVTYRLPYLPSGPINTGMPAVTNSPNTQSLTGRPEDTIFNPDSWEPNLRFWSVFENGLINYSYAYMQEPDANRHIIYRSNLLTGIARENFGGLGRSLLWWAIMASMGADIFLRCLQKYGMPILIAKVDTSQVDTVSQIMEAFGNLNIVNAMAVNKDAIIEISEMNYSGASQAHETFLQFCHDQISLLINGQTLGSHKATGGMGNGKDSLQSDIRNDIVKYDQTSLNTCLRQGLFKQILEINDIKGNIPNIVWGKDIEDVKTLSETISNLASAGIKPTEESLESLGERLGFAIQFMAENEKLSDESKDKLKSEKTVENATEN
jgi:phage gp29-like protein